MHAYTRSLSVTSRLLIAACLFIVAGAGRGHEGPGSGGEAVGEWVGPWSSGSWYAADRSGEGIILEFLPDGSAALLWFTFPSAGDSGSQAWLSAGGGRVEGDSLLFDDVRQPQGARFGDAFDPGDLNSVAWGTIRLRFLDCHHLQLSWQGRADYGSGSRELIRLSTLDQVDCDAMPSISASGMRTASGLRSKSGAWFQADRSGEGWVLEELADGRTLVYWFTYDPQGRQAWIVGAGQRSGEQLVVNPLYLASGTRFGEGFSAGDVVLDPWGQLQIDFQDCSRGRLQYQSNDASWGSGTREIQRLTSIAGAPCIDVTSLSTTQPSWVERAATPSPASSELAVTSYQSNLYALGGFAAPRSFRRYSPLSNSWSTLPALPSGRHHLAAFAIDGAIYYVGGEVHGDGLLNSLSYRFDLAQQTWSEVPELLSTYGSQAAVLHGVAYVGNTDGRLQRFDPRQRRSGYIPAADFRERDHAQLVAFLDEIWLIGGRSPETTAVAIYNPVSETWRSGPSMNFRRAGFSAGVAGARLFVAGGEVLNSGVYIEPSSEWIAAGMSSWQVGPTLPVPVHGSGGAGVEGRAFHVSGSVNAGVFAGATERVFELVWPGD